MDETYIKVKGQDKYLYRAVDSTGQTTTSCYRRSAIPRPQNASLRRYSAHLRIPFPRVINVDKTQLIRPQWTP
jgi:transposase-like protein